MAASTTNPPDLAPENAVFMPWQVTHLRVNDAASGRPTPVRLHLSTLDGTTLVPLGRLKTAPDPNSMAPGHLLWEDKWWAYIDGAAEALLPAGPLNVRLAKGPEFTPSELTVDRRVGQLALRLALQNRWSRPPGWYAGDCIARYLPPRAAVLEAAAEGLDVVHLAASHELELMDYSGQTTAWAQDGHFATVGTWNGYAEGQSLVLLNTHRVVFPMRKHERGFEQYTLADWAHQAHRKNGYVIWPFQPPDAEVLATLILGEIDAVGLLPETDFQAALECLYRLWDAGLPVAVVAGSGKRDMTRPLGLWRTWVGLAPESEFIMPAWIAALRTGPTVASDGPLLTIDLPRGSTAISPLDSVTPILVHVSAYGLDVGDQVEILVDGKVQARAAALDSHFKMSTEVTSSTPPWVAGRCWNSSGRLRAHTSAVFLNGRNKRSWSAAESLRIGLEGQAARIASEHRERLNPLIQHALSAPLFQEIPV